MLLEKAYSGLLEGLNEEDSFEHDVLVAKLIPGLDWTGTGTGFDMQLGYRERRM